jgi:hypothetical protein
MVVKLRSLPAVAAALSLLMVAAVPALGAYTAAQPDPLVKDQLLRVLDIATAGKTAKYGPVVAVGYRKDTRPGELYVTYSTDGGYSYLKGPGSLRQFRVAGDGMRGMSLDICGGRVWAATAATYPGDAVTDRDVLLTSRTIGGSAAQAFLTKSDADRTVSAVDVGCVGKKLLAVAWIEQSFGQSRAKLMLRSLEALGETPAYRKVIGLGDADRKGGISVDAGTDTVHVAWTAGADRDLRYQRFVITGDLPPDIMPGPVQTMASSDTAGPQVAARGTNAVVAYTDNGKAKVQSSVDGGATFGPAVVVVGTGSVASPSEVYTADVSGARIVIEATASKNGELTPVRIESLDSGANWTTRTFGNVGARVGGLRKDTQTSSILVESWQNNSSGPDTIRAQVER